ncbi:MAG: PEBP family protein [Ilumatobacteraceae bacterium]
MASQMVARPRLVVPVVFALASLAACGGDKDSADGATPTTAANAPDSTATGADSTTATDAGTTSTFTAEVWADNWFSLYVNGVLVGEDSVSIDTERSFNAETITFTASYPLTIAMVTKDFKETDSGLEYIGTDRQQMGDGGFIAQFTDTTTGQVVAVTSGEWHGLAIHRAPLNTDCDTSASPDTDCQFETLAEPEGWFNAGFDDSAWVAANTYSADDVGAKDGYNEISWDASAALIWTSDLKVDNTILWRFTATG